MEARCISSDRSMILHVLEHELKETAKTGFAPDFSCTIGSFRITRSGMITTEDDDPAVFIELAKLGLCDFPYTPKPPDPDVISYPAGEHSGRSLLNLFCFFSARQRLINRAIGAKKAFLIDPVLMNDLLARPPVLVSDLMKALYGRGDLYSGIRISPEYIEFPGFLKGPPSEAHIHRQLADRIIQASLKLRWAKAFAPDIRNKKYAFRNWLNELGMTGPEYEEARRVLLSRLPGRGDRRRIPRR